MLAFMYAGQGSQKVGMGQDLYEKYPVFKEAFDSADLDFDLKEVCFTDSNGVINETRYTQPCMVAFATGITKILFDKGIHPDYVCGLSLGEYSALNAAGVFDSKQAIELVEFRGRAMQEASKGIEAGMSAVINLPEEELQKCCDEAKHLGVISICNYNSPDQLVIGGELAAVEEAGRLAKERGAKRVLPLKVSGPFHTSLMSSAGEALKERFETESFNEMQIPVLFNCLGDIKAESDKISDLLVRQVQSSVYMVQNIEKLAELGVDTVIEIGPGKALSGFVKKTVQDKIRCIQIEKVEDIEALEEKLSEVK